MEKQPTLMDSEHRKSAPNDLKRINSQEIFAGETQVLIQHGMAEYLLRITRQGKLILTK